MMDHKIGLLFARLTEDNDGHSVRETVCQTLQQELGDIIEILMWPEAIAVNHGHDVHSMLAALATAREWLAEMRCDLLLWGQIKRGRVLSVQFTGMESSIASEQCFPPSVTFEIPLDLLSEFRMVIVARVLASIASIDGTPNQNVIQAMRLAAEELATIVKHSATNFNTEMRGTLLYAYGNVLQRIGEHSSNSEDLIAAISVYRSALDDWTRERFPLRWAAIHSELGNAFQVVGDRESNEAWLREAVVAHQEALGARSREHVPLLWAVSQNNLGRALCALGERENRSDRFEQAVEAFREALKEWTRERVPLQWAMVQNSVAMALCAMGEREVGVARLQEAIEALRGARECCTRDGSPRLWTMFQHNLGNSLRALGERTTGTVHLQEGIAAIREALNYTPRDQFPMQWASIQHDLGVALVRLGEREGGIRLLNEAVGAFHEALKERSPECAPLQWAMTQSCLGNALVMLGELRSNALELQQAVTAYSGALGVLESRGPVRYRETVGRSLARTEMMLTKQRRKELAGAIRRPDASLRLS